MPKLLTYFSLLILSSFLLAGCSSSNYEYDSDSSERYDREYELEERADRLQQELDDREQELQEREEAIENARYEMDEGNYSDAYDSLEEY